MNGSKIRFITYSTILLVFWFAWLAQPLPVLDEESYLWIAENLSWDRPYDWPLPWPPFEENAYIYAHPPLFLWTVKAAMLFTSSVSIIKWLLAIPWQLLLIGSVAWLAIERSKYPWQMLLLWASMAGVALPITRSLMPDLQVSALATFAMTVWILSPRDLRWMCAGGLALGLAAWTKYPALLLVVVPLMHPRDGIATTTFVGSAIGLVLLGECWLAWNYGQFHLLEVLIRAPEIARGSLDARLIGVCNRLPVAAFGFVLIALLHVGRFKYWFLLAFAVFGWWKAKEMSVQSVYIAALLTAVGGQSIRFLLGKTALHTWAWIVFFGVLIAHNYASPRYWLLAMAPVTLLVLEMMTLKGLMWGVLLLSSVGTHLLARTEALHALESQKLAKQVQEDYPQAEFSGEWTFRWQMRQLGMKHLQQNHPKWVLVARNSSGGLTDSSQYDLLRTVAGEASLLHLVSAENSVGYYSETIGFWPIWVGYSPVEQVQVWKRK